MTTSITLRVIFQPNFSNLNLGKWREKLERKLFDIFDCTAKTPINQGFSRMGFQNDHWFSSPQCKMEVNRKSRTLTHFIYLLRKIAEQQPFSYYYNLYSNSLQDPIFQEKWWRESRQPQVEPSQKALYIKGFRRLLSNVASGFRIVLVTTTSIHLHIKF